MTSDLKPGYTCRRYGMKYDRARTLLELMREMGWCKRTLFCLDGKPHNLGISNLWFYAHMRPPRHSYESVVDGDNYQVDHMRSDCDCKLVGPSPEIVKDIIESGGFPVISLTDSGYVKVERSNAVRGGHVSVSHVWSNGHGNPDDNTLPTCFLTYLSDCVDNALGAGQSPFDLRSYSQLPSMLSR